MKRYSEQIKKGHSEEYSEMKEVFGRMAETFGYVADRLEEKNRIKATKRAKETEAAKKEYYSIFTKEEVALLSSANKAKAEEEPKVHDVPVSEPFVRNIPEESDKEKEWRTFKEKEQDKMLRREYGDERAALLKRDTGRNLTRQSGTRSTEDKSKAEAGSSLKGNVTMQNIGIQRESMGRIRRAVDKEQESVDVAREKEAIRIHAQTLANKLNSKSWLELTAEELEDAKSLFGDKLPEIIRLNEKRFTGLGLR
jgi:hypothetical protein